MFSGRNFWQSYSLCHSHIIKLTSTWLPSLSFPAHPVYADIFCFLLDSMETERLLSFPHTHQPLCKFKLRSWTFWIVRIFTACFVFTHDPSESLDPPLSTFGSFLNPFLVTLALSLHAWTQTYDPGTGSWAVLILSAIIWQKGNTKDTNSDIIKLIAQLAVVTGRSEHQPGVSSVWPLIREPSSPLRQLPRMHLSSCRSAVATESCSLTDCSHSWRRFEIWNTEECFTCALLNEFRHMHRTTHTCSRAMCVSPNSLWQRVFAVFMLHHSLSSLTAWPSNTAFQWQLKFNTYKFFETLIQFE